MTFGNILTLAGGLGLFLFGMKMMSESIEKAAGAKLRKILEIFTTNKFAGLGVGYAVGIFNSPNTIFGQN